MVSEKCDDFEEVCHRYPRNISRDIGQCRRKRTQEECENTAIHQYWDGWCSKEIGDRSDKRKRPKIKECNRKCPYRCSDSQGHGFIKKWSQKRKKSSKTFPKRDNTYDREKRELETDIIGDGEWICESEK